MESESTRLSRREKLKAKLKKKKEGFTSFLSKGKEHIK